MKILFLDIDGVLNSEMFYKNSLKNKLNHYFPIWKVFHFFGLIKLYHWIIDAYDKDSWECSQLDSKTIKLLNHVIEETDCKIVLSSTWRKHKGGYKKVEELMKRKGFVGEIIDATPVLWTKRGQEIEQWLSQHDNIENYVIVDDDSDFTDEQILKHFVWTDRVIGFSSTSAYKCTFKLGKI